MLTSQPSISEILQVIREAQAVNRAEIQAVVQIATTQVVVQVAVTQAVVQAVAVQATVRATVALSSKEANHEHIKK